MTDKKAKEMRTLLTALGLAFAGPAALVMATAPIAAQTPIKEERVSFPKGRTSTVITRTIKGRQTIDFLVRARAGQRLVASMTSPNRSAYFNIIAPSEQNVAFYAGDMSTPLNSFKGRVPRSGDLRFRVYLYRNAARMGQTATIRLSISITGAGGSVTQLPGSAPEGGAASHLPGYLYWEVAGVPRKDILNVRAAPSASSRIVGALTNGTIVRDAGCQTSGNSRWCKIVQLDDMASEGWVNASFLRRSGPPR